MGIAGVYFDIEHDIPGRQGTQNHSCLLAVFVMSRLLKNVGGW